MQKTAVGKSDFVAYLRTGIIRTPDVELKFNPWHDPADGRFTFSGAGRYFGRGYFRGGGGSFGGGGATGSIPRAQSPASHAGRVERQSAAANNVPRVFGAHLPVTQTMKPAVARSILARTQSASPPEILQRHVANGYAYDLDGSGRTRQVNANLRLAPARRSPSVQSGAGKPDRLSDDDGGHYIAARFDGPRDEFNHFAQNANFNRGGYRALEDNWAKAIRSGSKVHVNIRTAYHGASRRPDIIVVTERINGRSQLYSFRNRRGGR